MTLHFRYSTTLSHHSRVYSRPSRLRVFLRWCIESERRSRYTGNINAILAFLYILPNSFSCRRLQDSRRAPLLPPNQGLPLSSDKRGSL
ncbi:hypothetical protein CPB86DRAFT_149715 [Serendipita vermifera]|nr:hypothetical protein CPB86DRAFT_149715 [Serendipita vermifera]